MKTKNLLGVIALFVVRSSSIYGWPMEKEKSDSQPTINLSTDQRRRQAEAQDNQNDESDLSNFSRAGLEESYPQGKNEPSLDPELINAKDVEAFWTDKKIQAVKEVQKTKQERAEFALNPAEEITQAQVAKRELKEQIDKIVKDVEGADTETATRSTTIAQAYLNAAEEAEQVEYLWTIRKKKNEISTRSLNCNSPHGAARMELNEACRWAQFTPAQRREELMGDTHYQQVDALYNEAQQAWDRQTAARWAKEHHALLEEKIIQALQKEKEQFASKDLRKTMAGKIVAATDKTTQVLNGISFHGLSPAVLSQAIAIVADIINRRIEKAPLKAATQAACDYKEILQALNEAEDTARDIAGSKEGQAKRAEEEALAKSELPAIAYNVAQKLKMLFEELTSFDPNNITHRSTRFAAIKALDPDWTNAVSVWRKRMNESEKLIQELEHLKKIVLPPPEEMLRTRNNAKTAQSQFLKIKEAEIEQNITLIEITNELKQLDDEIRDWKADAETSLDDLAHQKRNKQAQIGYINNDLQSTLRELEALQAKATALEESATQLERNYKEKHKRSFDAISQIQRRIDRAKARADADGEAYRAIWPEEAEREDQMRKALAQREALLARIAALKGLQRDAQNCSIPTEEAFMTAKSHQTESNWQKAFSKLKSATEAWNKLLHTSQKVLSENAPELSEQEKVRMTAEIEEAKKQKEEWDRKFQTARVHLAVLYLKNKWDFTSGVIAKFKNTSPDQWGSIGDIYNGNPFWLGTISRFGVLDEYTKSAYRTIAISEGADNATAAAFANNKNRTTPSFRHEAESTNYLSYPGRSFNGKCTHTFDGSFAYAYHSSIARLANACEALSVIVRDNPSLKKIAPWIPQAVTETDDLAKIAAQKCRALASSERGYWF